MAIGLGFGKNKSKSTNQSASTQTLDPQLSGVLYDNVNANKAIAATPVTAYEGTLNAGWSPVTDEAANAARSATSFYAPNVTAGQLADVDISKYFNPFQAGVIDSAMQDSERARQIALNNDKAEAIAGKAFGGGRSGVLSVGTNTASARSRDDMIAKLRMQGFDTASANAIADLNRTFAADQGNQGAAVSAAGIRVNGAGVLGQIGATQTAAMQSAADREYQEFLRQQQDPMVKAALMNGAIGLLPNYGTTSSLGSSKGTSTSVSASGSYGG